MPVVVQSMQLGQPLPPSRMSVVSLQVWPPEHGALRDWQSRVALQVSAPSQNRPLSQLASLVAFTTMSFTSSQESSVQVTPSSITGGVPA